MTALADDVEGGDSLSVAMAKHTGVFDDLYLNMVKAGEAGGLLDEILERLAQFAEKAEEIKGKITGALAYPLLVTIFATAVIFFVMTFVVPQFQEIFEQLDAKLPRPTEILIGCRHLPEGQLVDDLPGRGPALRPLPDAPAGDRLQALRAPAAAAPAAVRAAGAQDGDRPLRAHARHAAGCGRADPRGARDRARLGEQRRGLRGPRRRAPQHPPGRDHHPAMAESGVFDDIVVNMVDVGEESGNLDHMLLKVADAYEREVDESVTTIFRIVEPVILVVLSIVVGAIVVSLFLPILQVMDQLAGGG